jgi:hypothetical protein
MGWIAAKSTFTLRPQVLAGSPGKAVNELRLTWLNRRKAGT